MGNTTGMLIIWMGISLFSMLFALSIQAVDPCSQTLVSNTDAYVFNNIIASVATGRDAYFCASGSIVAYATSDGRYEYYDFANNLQNDFNTNIQRGTTGDSSTASSSGSAIFPDWLYTSYKWITTPLTVGAFILNLITAPYTLMTSFFPNNPSVGAFIGIFFSVLNLWFFVNYITGKDN